MTKHSFAAVLLTLLCGAGCSRKSEGMRYRLTGTVLAMNDGTGSF